MTNMTFVPSHDINWLLINLNYVGRNLHIPSLRAVILEKVCKYLYYKVRHTNTTQEIPDFPIEADIALELLMAADFLDC
jgi:hypothetical protein